MRKTQSSERPHDLGARTLGGKQGSSLQLPTTHPSLNFDPVTHRMETVCDRLGRSLTEIVRVKLGCNDRAVEFKRLAKESMSLSFIFWENDLSTCGLTKKLSYKTAKGLSALTENVLSNAGRSSASRGVSNRPERHFPQSSPMFTWATFMYKMQFH